MLSVCTTKPLDCAARSKYIWSAISEDPAKKCVHLPSMLPRDIRLIVHNLKVGRSAAVYDRLSGFFEADVTLTLQEFVYTQLIETAQRPISTIGDSRL